MENKKRVVMWTTFSAVFVLAVVQHVDAAVIMNNVRKSGDNGVSHGKRLFVPKYMIDLYNIVVDKHGNRRKGISTMADKIKCFLPGASSNISKNFLTFDIRDVKRDEQIIKAYLVLFKMRPASVSKPTGFFRVDVVDNSDGHVAATRLLNLRGGGWKSFDLTSTVNAWHKRRYKENAIHVDVKGYQNGENGVFFSRNSNIEQGPFLVLHSRSNVNHVTRSANRAQNPTAKLSKPGRGSRYKRGSNRHPCRRKSMIVDTTKIGWDSYVLSPRIFDAYRCEGKCGAYSSQATNTQTNHAVLQAILAQLGTVQDGKPIKAPCCAPSAFENKTLLLFRKVKGQDVIGLEDFTDMVVKSCACL